MNDGNLLIYGCAVCLIALAGAYAYLRESFLGEQKLLGPAFHHTSVPVMVVDVDSKLETRP